MPKKAVPEKELIETLIAYVNGKLMNVAGKKLGLTTTGIVLRLDKLERMRGRLLVRSGGLYVKRRLPHLNKRGTNYVLSHGYRYDENVDRWYKDQEKNKDEA